MAIQVEFLNQQLPYVRILSAEALATAATTIPILLMFSILPRTLPRPTHGAWKVKARDGYGPRKCRAGCPRVLRDRGRRHYTNEAFGGFHGFRPKVGFDRPTIRSFLIPWRQKFIQIGNNSILILGGKSSFRPATIRALMANVHSSISSICSPAIRFYGVRN